MLLFGLAVPTPILTFNPNTNHYIHQHRPPYTQVVREHQLGTAEQRISLALLFSLLMQYCMNEAMHQSPT